MQAGRAVKGPLAVALTIFVALGGISAAARTQLTASQVRTWAKAYLTTHPGKAHDINAKTSAQLASDSAARRLLSICGPGQRPVIPILAWEYGGSDHEWINPGASALAYCVYVPAKPYTSHWRYDAATDHVTADVYVRFPHQNRCRNKSGAQQVLGCLGDPSNIEILVDTASIHDGADVGLNLSNSSTTLHLIEPSGKTITLVTEH